MNVSPYSWLLLAGILVSLYFWSRLARRDERLLFIYIAALIGAFLGAKIVYLLAEGWLDWAQPDRWTRLATGKTILGGLLGGYAAVELAKNHIAQAIAQSVRIGRHTALNPFWTEDGARARRR